MPGPDTMVHVQHLHVLCGVKGIAYTDWDQLYPTQLQDGSRWGVISQLNRHHAEAVDEQTRWIHSVLPSIPA